jgi:uncharacterized membrane protein (UPF0127 family)
MTGLRYIAATVIFIALLLIALWWGFARYHGTIYEWFSYEGEYNVVFEDITITVTVADDEQERRQGLSGTPSLGELEGMLFVFESSARHGMWMKDMLIPLDMIWISDDLTIVHIEENVTPDSYPRIFSSREPARFVLETNASFVESFGITVGQKVGLPRAVLPQDLQNI